jgi:hypothetical protein
LYIFYLIVIGFSSISDQNKGILSEKDFLFLKSDEVRNFITSILSDSSLRTSNVKSSSSSTLDTLISIISRIFSTWGVGGNKTLLLPAVDLIRVLSLHTDVATLLGKENLSDGKNPLYILNIYNECFADNIPVSSSNNSSKIPPPSDSLKLMFGRILVNLFGNSIGEKLLCSTTTLPSSFNPPKFLSLHSLSPLGIFFLSVSINLTQESYTAFLQQVGACIIHNTILILKKNNSESDLESNPLFEFVNNECVTGLFQGLVRVNEKRINLRNLLSLNNVEEREKKVKEAKDYEDTFSTFLRTMGLILLDNLLGTVNLCSQELQNIIPLDFFKSINGDKNEKSDVVKNISGEIVEIISSLQ